jgi:HEAT repeat protein
MIKDRLPQWIISIRDIMYLETKKLRWFLGMLILALGVLGWTLHGLRSTWRAPAHRFVPGGRAVHRLDYRNVAHADLRPLLQGVSTDGAAPSATSSLVQDIQTGLRGELISTVVSQDEAGVIVAYHVRTPAVSIESNGQGAAEQARTIERDLSREIFATIDRQGRIVAVRFDPAVGQASRDFARVLLGIVQFVLPGESTPDGRAWETTEEDPSGQYIAHYEAVADAQGREDHGVDVPASCRLFHKRKLRYLPPPADPLPGEIPMPRAITPHTELLTCFDTEAGRLALLHGKETLVTALGEHRVARSETTIEVTFDSHESLSVDDLIELQKDAAEAVRLAAAIPLSAMASAEEMRTAARRSTLGDDTLESLLAALAQQEAAGGQDEIALFLRFRALAHLQPEVSPTLARKLAEADASSLTFRVLTEALGAVGSTQAQAALVSAVEARSGEWPALYQLIPALGLGANPTPEAVATIRGLAFASPDPRIASTAQLALGTMARNATGSSPERAAEIVDLILAHVDSASFAHDPGQLLLVLGNTGSERALPTITRFTDHAVSEVRAAAATALRFVETARAEALLLRMLSSDQDGAVRAAAAYALSFRALTHDAFQAQKTALLNDTDKDVRLAVLSNLGKALGARPEISSIIERVAREDPAPDVRDAARVLAPADAVP